MNMSVANTTAVWNGTLEAYLLKTRGDKYLDIHKVLPVTIVYALIFVTGVVGNVAVCGVIVRTPEMHTATNYYLFSLAISDLALLLLGLPNDLSLYWEQYPWAYGETVCKIRAAVSEMMSYTSVLTIVAFSTERYLAICHPLYSYSMKGLRRALRIIALVWLVSLVSAAPFAVYTKVGYVDYPPHSGNIVEESAFCAALVEDIPSNYPMYELSFVLFFLVPMLVMLVLYLRMGLTIWSPHQKMVGSVHRRVEQSQSRKTIVRMLAAVVVAFFLCWAPFHLQRLLYVYGRGSPHYWVINEWLFYITGVFYYLSSTVNPILYNVMSAKYRDAFVKTLLCRTSSRRAQFRDTFSTQDGLAVQRTANNRSKNNHTVNEQLVTASAADVMVVTSNGKAHSYIAPVPGVANNRSKHDHTVNEQSVTVTPAEVMVVASNGKAHTYKRDPDDIRLPFEFNGAHKETYL